MRLTHYLKAFVFRLEEPSVIPVSRKVAEGNWLQRVELSSDLHTCTMVDTHLYAHITKVIKTLSNLRLGRRWIGVEARQTVEIW